MQMNTSINLELLIPRIDRSKEKERGGYMKFKPSGIIVPHITPFNSNGELDEEGLRKDVNFWIESGVNALIACASNGEAIYMTRQERRTVVKIVLEEVNERVPVLAGSGSAGTRQAIVLTNEARDLGVDGVLVVTPYYFKPDQNQIYQYYKDIAEAVDVPIILYNVPKFTGLNMEPQIVQRLTEVDNIVGIKDSSGNMRQIQELIRLVGDKISVLAGSGNMIYPTLVSGGHGAVVAVANVAPSLTGKIYDAYVSADQKTARETQLNILPLNNFLTKLHGIPAIKAALDMMGKIGGYPRKPFTVLGKERRDELKSLLKGLGLV